MEARCVARYIRVAPRKMRLVANLVRGKTVNEALGILQFTPRAGSSPILKAVKSAVANIVNRDDAKDVNPDELVVKTIFIDEGPTYRRFLPRAMGRATPIRKRMSHITVDVAVPEAPVEAAEGAPVEGEEAAPKKTKAVKKPVKKAAPKKKAAAKKPAVKRSAKKKTE